MIRIVGVERNRDPQREFILLQNQGVLRQTLRGHAVIPELAIEGCPSEALFHLFVDDVAVHPGAFIMLRTGSGEPRWTRTRDGSNVYNAFMQRGAPVWDHVHCPIHVLCTQHTFVERATSAVTLR